jgi:4'-phosphopantetheinyl transferase
VGKLAEPSIGKAMLAAVRLSAVDLGQAHTLDDAERQLAAAFRSAGQRDRFLAGRIALRLHAANVAGASPGSLQADYVCRNCMREDRAHGMPLYRAGPGRLPVRASLSRSGDWCLLAATTDEQVLGVGVDLESRASADFEGFEAVAMTAREREYLQTVAPPLRSFRQTQLWTRKEAVLKALGTGLIIDPALVDVAGAVPLVPGRRHGSEGWLVEDLSPGSVGLPDDCFAVMALLLK